MSDILLAKPVLPEGWIDLSVGEAVVVRNALLKHFNLSLSHASLEGVLDYPAPNGNKQLVKILEDKYQSPVILTNGCKQALGASFYLLNKLGCKSVGMKSPYWALIPPLVKAHNLIPALDGKHPVDAWLELSPNNPDGDTLSFEDIKNLESSSKDLDIPLIHDAAYYTHAYLPEDYSLIKFGDLQLYSVSKMYGLSGLRLGYIVCHNTDYYKTLCEYVEMMTVGVSTASQQLLLQLLQQEKIVGRSFESESFNNLKKAKQLLKNINPDVLEIPNNFEETPGMFAWAKVKNISALTAAKINVISGEPFGDAKFIRMNLGVPLETLEEVIERLRIF